MATESKKGVVVGKVKGSSSVHKDKKIETSSKSNTSSSGGDSKNKSFVTVTKTEVKSKPVSGLSKTITTKTTKVREKKVYSLPGQKHDPPEEREPPRIFYETLSKQIPTSEMAEFWMMEHGLLSPERAKKAYEKKQRKQKMQRTGTPVKPPKTPSKPESSQRQQAASRNGDVKAKKRINNDFIISPKKRKG